MDNATLVVIFFGEHIAKGEKRSISLISGKIYFCVVGTI
tara:strand:+ start:7155 stop:7271 length:117 start_codon:yes stop_codon:yes gene_type:complete